MVDFNPNNRITNALNNAVLDNPLLKNLQVANLFQSNSVTSGSGGQDLFSMSIDHVEDFLTQALGENADFARQQLMSIKLKLDENNKVRKALREALNADPEDRADILREVGLQHLVQGRSGDEEIKAIEAELETQGDINSKIAFAMQVAANLVNQSETLMSTIRKKFDEAASTIIRNI
jgi:hypothetical protein